MIQVDHMASATNKEVRGDFVGLEAERDMQRDGQAREKQRAAGSYEKRLEAISVGQSEQEAQKVHV